MGAQWKAKGKELAANAKGKVFGKLAKEIMVAARSGADPASNAKLRLVVEQARKVSMPKDTLERAIKKGAGELEGVNHEELNYEAYAPGGGALFIEVLTDNKNRAAAEIRNILTRTGSNLAATGSVAYLFKRKGVLSYDGEQYTEDKILEAALEAGADDVVSEDGGISVYTDPASFETVLNAMNAAGFATLGAEISMVPDIWVTPDADNASKVHSLIDRLEECEDVQNVYHNVELPETDEE